MHKRLIIIGSGPAGYTAAIYTARANLSPLVLAGTQSGGQLMITTDVDNYPGFPKGIQGPELMERFREQAERFGAEMIDRDVTFVDLSQRPFLVRAGDELYTCDSIIIATGANAKWIGLESELRLRGRGVSACATCDAFFFKGKNVFVVGGGDTAMEEAIFLSKFAKTVTVVHRRDALRASKIMQERAMANPKISFMWNSLVTNVIGEEHVTALEIENLKAGSKGIVPADGLFIAIGHIPSTILFTGQLETDGNGYVVVRNLTRTSVDGVFAAGDVKDARYRQAVTAAGSGCEAALDAEKYLGEHHQETIASGKIPSPEISR
ncbi:MAG: thioredoxin-disulfide reductase [Thaumarchaeota archaeon]|nr:thioredoxin-disulfide reductase [Nitrososphaerota archaeon]